MRSKSDTLSCCPALWVRVSRFDCICGKGHRHAELIEQYGHEYHANNLTFKSS